MERVVGLPNLLIVGAAKSGTTSLHNYLNQHPDIFMCSPKEPHFLINKEIGQYRIPNGVIELDDYKSLFKGALEQKYRGESSVMYLSFPDITIKNIKKYLSNDVKIIIMLRNPIERAYSGYHHVKRYNIMENLSFEEALYQSEERYLNKDNMTPASRYLMLGNYYEQVMSFLEAFKHVHIIIYDDYKANFEEEIKKVFSFLEVNAIFIDTKKRHMVGGWEWKNNWIKKLIMQPSRLKMIIKYLLPIKSLRKTVRRLIQKGNTKEIPKMSLKTKQYLQGYYRENIKNLELLLDRDLKEWMS